MSNVFGFVPEIGLISKKLLAGYVTIDTTQTITGEKTFSSNLNTTNLIASNNVNALAVTAGNIYPTTAIVFPDGSSQVTAYQSLTPGTYTFSTITVNANGAISSISSGSSSNFVTLNTVQTITAQKTFDLPPFCSTVPTTSTMLTNKAYIDNNFVTLATAQSITANKTFANSSVIIRDNDTPQPKSTTLTQNLSSDRFEMNQTYYNGGFLFTHVDIMNITRTIQFAGGGILADFYTVNNTGSGLGRAFHSYVGSDYTIENDVNGSIAFKTNSSNQFVINSTNCSFTNPPLCVPAPTTNAMLSNKGYVDSYVQSYVPANAVILSGNQTISGVKTFNEAPLSATTPTTANMLTNKAYVDNNFVSLATNQSISGMKTFTNKINFGSVQTSTIEQLVNQFNITNNNINPTVTVITGLIPAENFACLVRTDSVIPVANYGFITAGTNIRRDYLNNLYIGFGVSILRTITITSANTINSPEAISIGFVITNNIGTLFTLATYVAVNLGSGNYQLSQNVLVAPSSTKYNVALYFTPLNRAYLNIGAANGSITIDYETTTNLQCRNESNIMLNAIQIRPELETSNIFMYGNTYFSGNLNFNYGGVISSNTTLTFPLSQIYVITSAAATTITLPDPDATLTGTRLLFKRSANTQVITFRTVTLAANFIPFNNVLGVNTVTMTAAQFQTEFIFAPNAWLQFNMA